MCKLERNESLIDGYIVWFGVKPAFDRRHKKV